MELASLNQVNISREGCIYTSCFCEENVWKLCEKIKQCHSEHVQECFVVFISNNATSVPIWNQRSGSPSEEYLAVWDYHVIMIRSPSGAPALVYDLDTTLPFPCDFEVYSSQSLKNNRFLKEEYHRMFRVIPAEEFLKTFASDRSRMRKPDGSWLKPPPDYPCIRTDVCENNLDQFVSMDSNEFSVGEVLTLAELNARFGRMSSDIENDEIGF